MMGWLWNNDDASDYGLIMVKLLMVVDGDLAMMIEWLDEDCG